MGIYRDNEDTVQLMMQLTAIWMCESGWRRFLKFPPQRVLAGLFQATSHMIGPAGERAGAKPGGKKLEKTELS